MSLGLSLPPQLLNLQQQSLEAFAAVRERHQSLPASERQRTTLDEVWSALAHLRFQGFLVPERYGGTDAGLLASVLVMEELAAQGLHSFRPILLAMGSAAITQFGAEPLKQDVLPRIARGDLKLAIASTEAEAGFNVLNTRTFAQRRDDQFIINGSKIYVSGVDVADYMLLVTRTMTREECDQRGLPKTAGISLLLVETSADGVQRTRVPSRGEGALTQFALTLEDLRVPVSRLVGDEHSGAKPMFHMFNPERTLASAMALGMSRYCLDLARQHACTRKVFGRTPIGAYQSIQHPLADIAIRQQAVRLMTYRAAGLFDQGAPAGDLAESANAAKYLAAELAVRSVDAAIDTFGGKGFDEDHGIIHLWEAARLLKTAPISDALILNQTAERCLGLPRSY
ncbi:MAG: acyl-CoA/acyl-ACP dehydrogenase [Phycisphaerales bacterium]|nr:MAG: acyl-CoA/acyl-ACP dehydrogenase [Phycisphaerales bacterium]